MPEGVLNGKIFATDKCLCGNLTDINIGLGGNVSGSVVTSIKWGRITGNLEDQTDLDNALDKKINEADLEAISIYDIALLFK